jgi:hypothetical protein
MLKGDEDVNKKVISCAREPKVKIHDDGSDYFTLKSCRYEMRQHKGSVNKLSMNHQQTHVASGSDD